MEGKIRVKGKKDMSSLQDFCLKAWNTEAFIYRTAFPDGVLTDAYLKIRMLSFHVEASER